MVGIIPASNPIRIAYYKSIYQAGNVITKIGQKPCGIPKRLHYQSLIMLSAYNPGEY